MAAAHWVAAPTPSAMIASTIRIWPMSSLVGVTHSSGNARHHQLARPATGLPVNEKSHQCAAGAPGAPSTNEREPARSKVDAARQGAVNEIAIGEGNEVEAEFLREARRRVREIAAPERR